MPSDLEIARSVTLYPIYEIAEKVDIPQEFLLPSGNFKAKISLKFYEKIKNNPDGKLILITAINPTPYGEGKTTTAIGLSMAFWRIGKKSIVALREPSLGPVFGIKGGATGGGYSQVLPMEDINLHFTGDIHAVTSAHNLLSTLLDNHIHFGAEPIIDERDILFKRAIDMNDRSLRTIVIGLGGKSNGPAREDGFIITAASEVMAILSLATSLKDLKQRLANILVAFRKDGKPFTAGELGAHGPMAVLLRDALKPNIVQTIEHTPAFIHTGPFANIATGTCSIISMKIGLKICDYLVVESGFGADLGAEKFINIVSRVGNLPVDAAVLVCTIRALKHHGSGEDIRALRRGLANLGRHIEILRRFNIPFVVALNRFTNDKREEIKVVRGYCEFQQVPFCVIDVYEKGGEGAIELAQELIKITEKKSEINYTYNLSDSVEEKIRKVSIEIYGARQVIFTSKAKRDIERINALGFNNLPICIAKTQYSLSDNPALLGAPVNFDITINQININAGAGFLVPIAGEISLMPGLPKNPNALNIDLDENDYIVGLK
ncbi:MAG: formate--tetrahydrofolate ligase [candidate division WOR-3 bacterium]|nr:formate--tetrahydrofolate ligase [candidate division WOR-3 bacterium]MCX7836962.1 formate--tetrahydrofolate ligase [candidate division WOR-3 bacterium]MDW8114090.1 formate--tetrahydrofolate ligase [candidate division WOR-3 bacterium]